MAKVTVGGFVSSDLADHEPYQATVSPSGGKVLLDVASVSAPLASRVDVASASVTYVGKASLGSSESASVWQIQKISVSGNVTSILWADGDASFDNVWADRGSLSYS